MAISLWGVQGTVNEIQWAKLAQGFSQKYTLVNGNPVTAAGRTLTITPRLSVGCGVAVENSTNETVVTPTPTTGQWFLLVLRRVWGASRGASYALVNGPTTSDAAQTVPPSTLPGARNNTPGVMDDEPVAWVHARASTMALNIFQMSARPNGVVFGPWGLWSGEEQGIYRALSLSNMVEYRWSGTQWERDDQFIFGALTSITQAGTSSAKTNMNFGTTIPAYGYDTGEFVKSAAGFTIPVTGLYEFGWQAASSGVVAMTMYASLNGGTSLEQQYRAASVGGGGAGTNPTFSGPIKLNAGDVLGLTRTAASTNSNGLTGIAFIRLLGRVS